MARPARAVANKALKDKRALYHGKSVKKSKLAMAEGNSGEEDDEGQLSEQTNSTSGSDNDDGEHDAYKDQDSDDIDNESDAAEDLDVTEEENEQEEILRIHVQKDDSDGEEVLDFTVKKKSKTTHAISSDKKRKLKEAMKPKGSPSKRSKKGSDFEAGENASEDDEEEEEDFKNGRTIIRTKLVKAPSTTVKAGVIDPHTLGFLEDLIANNDRDW